MSSPLNQQHPKQPLPNYKQTLTSSLPLLSKPTQPSPFLRHKRDQPTTTSTITSSPFSPIRTITRPPLAGASPVSRRAPTLYGHPPEPQTPCRHAPTWMISPDLRPAHWRPISIPALHRTRPVRDQWSAPRSPLIVAAIRRAPPAALAPSSIRVPEASEPVTTRRSESEATLRISTSNLRFNDQYAKFQANYDNLSKEMPTHLSKLKGTEGGKRLVPVGLGDDDQYIEDDFTAWYSGPTMHFVNENFDTSYIPEQRVVPMLANETVEELAARGLH